MQQSLISVIVPVYNGQQYIEESLLSLVSQSWPALEIIVVDDGSSDNTAEIVQKLSIRYPIISLYKKENGGVSSARNLGLSVSRGTYIALQDADDISHPDRIEQQLKYLVEYDLALCGCGLSIFGRKNKGKDKLFPENDGELKANFLFFGRTIAGPSVLFRKDKVGDLEFNKSVAYGEDFDFILRVAFRNNNKVGNVQKTLYKYRQHDQQATATLEQTNRTNMINILRSFLEGERFDILPEVVFTHFDLCRRQRIADGQYIDLAFYQDLLTYLQVKGGGGQYAEDEIYNALKASHGGISGADKELFARLAGTLPWRKKLRLMAGSF